MAKPLVIVESPAKARTIAGYLGADYVVESSVGHIRSLPESAAEVPKKYKGSDAGRLGVDVENGFRPIYVVSRGKKDVVANLKKALKNASELYLATDEDREGEAIAWHVREVLDPDVPVRRLVFHEITRNAIEEALAHGRDLDMKLVEAQEGRRILDRLVGYELSPVLWKKVMPKLSAGRVQSVATRLVVERERARMAFRSGGWWDLEGSFAVSPKEGGDGSFAAKLTVLDGKRIPTGKDFDAATGQPSAPDEVVLLDEAEATALAGRLGDAEYRITSVETSPWRQQPHAPFITSTLQQEAGRKLRFTAARAMQVAQRLYERGFITYMRTDSTNLSAQAVTGARARIRELYGDDYLPEKERSYQRKVKNAQEAHEAIRPAGDDMRTAEQVRGELDDDEVRLYELIWMRTVASQMADARGQKISLRLGATSTTGEDAVFSASGRTIEFPGFMRAYVEGADDPDAELEDRESPVPPVSEGDQARCESLAPTGHTTQPPARFTEASLVKEMEEDGIGRPSTYATVIQTIQERGYVWKKGSALVPSWTAFAVVQLLERHFDHLVDYQFTARMEEDLDGIANNEAESEKWLADFYFGDGQVGLKELVADDHLDQIDKESVNTVPLFDDPEGRPIVVRVWPNGASVQRGDDKAPIAPDIAPDELKMELIEELLERAAAGPRVLGTDPNTDEKVLVLNGRFGPFVQLGEIEDGSKEKPPRASLFEEMTPESVTLEEALALLSLPRVVGVDEDGTEITAQNGRYGPYLKKGTDSRSLEREEQLFTITKEEADAIFAQPKQRRGQRRKPPIAELGPHPESGEMVRVLDGRYGPYATDGTTNATIPRGTDPASVTLDEAVALIRDRAAKGPVKKRPRKKKAATKKRKATKKKEPAKKRTAAKKKATAAAKAVLNDDSSPNDATSPNDTSNADATPPQDAQQGEAPVTNT
ncbi:MAG TPA: type I DNA topoisomerase [Acidimicrobiia bacterium]|nr:type I DNA topoisomerase [Acidimicrobiia bacterium]